MPTDPRQLDKNWLKNQASVRAFSGFSEEAARDFAFRITRSWLDKAENGSGRQALLRQVLPTAEELLHVPGYSRDPLNEAETDDGGLIEKYPGRLLVMVSRSCSAHCRFCFRRHALNTAVQQDALQADFRNRLENDPEISEVILSGGDPLVLSVQKLRAWFDLVREYPRVRRLRIHTREPVFSPDRITPALASLIRDSGLPVIVAVHVNHADELDGATAQALRRLREAGAILLTQTVLLRDVNDSVKTLQALLERAVECGMTPYYLHQLDRVAGAAHFAVEKERGLEIFRELRQRLPGYLVPRYVEEVPGERSKRPISPGDCPCRTIKIPSTGFHLRTCRRRSNR